MLTVKQHYDHLAASIPTSWNRKSCDEPPIWRVRGKKSSIAWPGPPNFATTPPASTFFAWGRYTAWLIAAEPWDGTGERLNMLEQSRAIARHRQDRHSRLDLAQTGQADAGRIRDHAEAHRIWPANHGQPAGARGQRAARAIRRARSRGLLRKRPIRPCWHWRPTISLSHHENGTGTGYPQGLAG